MQPPDLRRVVSLCVGVTVLAGVAVWVVYRSWDATAPPGIEDLVGETVATADAENGALAVLACREFWPWGADGEADPEIEASLWEMSVGVGEFDRALADTAIARNETALQTLEDALARPYFRIPEGPRVELGHPDAAGELFRNILHLGVLGRLRGALLWRQGNQKDATAVIMATAKLGHAYQEGADHSLDWSAGGALVSHACQLLCRLAAFSKLQNDQLRVPLSCLQPVPVNVGRCLGRDYIVFAMKVDAASARGLKGINDLLPEAYRYNGSVPGVVFGPAYLLKPNVTKRIAADGTRRMARAISLPGTQKPVFDPEFFDSLGPHIMAAPWSPNVVGRFLAEQFLTGQSRWLLDSVDFQRAVLSVTECVIAVARFRLTNGRLPATLTELAPEFMKEVPVGPYDGMPIRYFKEQGLVVSVGMDGELNAPREFDDFDVREVGFHF